MTKHARQAEPSAWESKQFSGVFLPELLAVEARRRRYRIEQILGSMPTPPHPLPGPIERSPDEVKGAAPSLDELKKKQQDTDIALQQLEEARRKNVEAEAASTQPVKTAAKLYLSSAQVWHQDAKAYRDAHLKAGKDERMEAGTDETQTNPLREQAEVIFAAAANALSLAAKEVRVEQDGDAKGETKAIATTPEDAFGQVLAWEKRTGEDLKTYHQAANREAAVRNAEAEVKKAEEAKGQTQKARIEAEAAKQKLRLAEDRRRKAEKHLLEAQEALKQAEGERGEVTALRKATTAVYGSRFQLALAERRLFEAAAAYLKGKGDNERSESCSRAADAAKREEQRASRELHRVQSEQSEAEKGANPEWH